MSKKGKLKSKARQPRTAEFYASRPPPEYEFETQDTKVMFRYRGGATVWCTFVVCRTPELAEHVMAMHLMGIPLDKVVVWSFAGSRHPGYTVEIARLRHD